MFPEEEGRRRQTFKLQDPQRQVSGVENEPWLTLGEQESQEISKDAVQILFIGTIRRETWWPNGYSQN